MNRPRGRGRLLLLTFVALSVVLITLDYRGNLGPIESARSFSQDLVAPLQRGLSSVGRPIGNFFSSIGDLARLRDENQDLTQRLATLQEEIDQARELADDNLELRRHLNLDEPWFAQERVTAQVISDAPGNFRWAVVIDKGSEDGIRDDMAVISPRGLVGKIVRSDPHRAVVLLLIDPKGGAAAEIEDSSADGLVSGNGGGRDLSLHFVEKQDDVGPGDLVVTSNFDSGLFPAGIPIGTVSDIGGDARAASLDVRVRPFVGFGDLGVVAVLLGPEGPRSQEGRE